MKLSNRFLISLKMAPEPAYRIAQRARLSPSLLSKWVCGIEPVRVDDPRILRVAELLGIAPEEVFESVDESEEG